MLCLVLLALPCSAASKSSFAMISNLNVLCLPSRLSAAIGAFVATFLATALSTYRKRTTRRIDSMLGKPATFLFTMHFAVVVPLYALHYASAYSSHASDLIKHIGSKAYTYASTGAPS